MATLLGDAFCPHLCAFIQARPKARLANFKVVYSFANAFMKSWESTPGYKLISLTWLLWTLRSFQRFTLHYGLTL